MYAIAIRSISITTTTTACVRTYIIRMGLFSLGYPIEAAHVVYYELYSGVVSYATMDPAVVIDPISWEAVKMDCFLFCI